jgi:hypothetical protein
MELEKLFGKCFAKKSDPFFINNIKALEKNK